MSDGKRYAALQDLRDERERINRHTTEVGEEIVRKLTAFIATVVQPPRPPRKRKRRRKL